MQLYLSSVATDVQTQVVSTSNMTEDEQTQMIPTSSTTSTASTLSSSTTPTTEPNSPPVTLLLNIIIPAVVISSVALVVSVIVSCACICTKMRKHRPAQKENSSDNKMPHTRHSDFTQTQHSGNNSDNVVPELHPQVYDYIDVDPTSPVYAVADAESGSGSLTASGGEYLYVDKSISFHPRNFSPGVDEMVLSQNCAYSVSLNQSPAQLPLNNESSN